MYNFLQEETPQFPFLTAAVSVPDRRSFRS
jgi:hypothetical protein